mmetsp:Transcript_17897/g.28549  ORF Transcript_17897/g.28549 Transcript_17897/m.28549 type:complete len:90 (+) Transcript_17897:1248-1517(+)
MGHLNLMDFMKMSEYRKLNGIHRTLNRDCCSVLQCVVVCCSVLQFVAIHMTETSRNKYRLSRAEARSREKNRKKERERTREREKYALTG